MVQKWLVCVDGSDISQKTFRVASKFMTNADQEVDELTVAHAFDPLESKPLHLSPEHIKHHYEVELSRASAAYEVTGPQPLEIKYHSLEIKAQGGKVGIRDKLIEYTETVARPHMVFLGSFGQGGEKVDALGTIPQGFVKLAKNNVALIKNTAPEPEFEEGTKFVVAIDGNSEANVAARELVSIVKPHDIVEIVHVALRLNVTSDAVLQKCKMALKDARRDGGVKVSYDAIQTSTMGSEGVAKALMAHATLREADFIVTASRALTGGTRFRCVPGGGVSSISALLVEQSRCHNIVMKPVYEEGAAGGLPRSASGGV